MKPFPYMGPTDWPSILKLVGDTAQDYDRSGEWPQMHLDALAAGGAMRWAAPRPFGDDLPALELHLKYEEIAAASLTTALILTQRDSAVGLIDASAGAPKRDLMLGRFANNEHFTTVGIAQLTTSRQGKIPALRAERAQGGYTLNGTIPWCTGARRAQFIVAGAAMPDGQQILFILESHAAGVTIQPVMELVALRSSFTSQVELKDVFLGDRWLLRGPMDQVLAKRPRSLNLGQTFLATGLCRGALDLIAAHDSGRARETLARFEKQLAPLRAEIASLCAPGRESEAAEASPRIRGGVQ
jgi:alkylation response protein AidB-like acyl-CoA dehydrogenase